MDPTVLARIHDLQAIATFAAVLLIAFGLYLAFAPIATCDQCDHCRRERLEQAKRWPMCPVCFTRHAPSEPHGR